MSDQWCDEFCDPILCWPRTKADTVVLLGCPDEISGFKYETQYNVTRFCDLLGNWMKANYTGCLPVKETTTTELSIPEWHLTIMYHMYWVGYCISLIFLVSALIVFVNYKSLWCLRNIIHTNLIFCFILQNLTWILHALITHEIIVKQYKQIYLDYCFVPMMILKYFIAAGFFWMFVEGMYLFVSVTFLLHTSRIRFWMCAILGWGVPFILILLTSIISLHNHSLLSCFMDQFYIDYIFIIPVLAVLIMNVLFLIITMSVVVRKLRVIVPSEITRYKKTMKALFILCPLLGMNYILVVVQTGNEPVWLKLTLSYYNTITSSSQGLLVAIFFCFQKIEVQNSIGKTIQRWRGRPRSRSQVTKIIVSNNEYVKQHSNKNSPLLNQTSATLKDFAEAIPMNILKKKRQTTQTEIHFMKLYKVNGVDESSGSCESL